MEIVVFLVVLIWVFGFLYVNDFSVPTRNKIPSDIKKILLIFPHADDEALTSGGLVSGLTRSGKEVYWVVLTKGEKGNPKEELDTSLKNLRVQEAKTAASIYNIKNIIQKDYPDGGVEGYRKKLEKDLRDTINTLNPDLVITYDQAGLYGHPDHIVTSQVVTELLNDIPHGNLWYASYPKRILDAVSLPEHMAKDKNYKSRRSYPTHKVWVGVTGVLNKIKAVYAYKSQRESYVSSMPVSFIPLWIYISFTPFEYYHERQ